MFTSSGSRPLTDETGGTAPARWRWMTIGVLALGIALRLGYLSLNTSLWSDAAAVFRNLQERSFAGLALPLAENQHALLQ